MNTDRRLEYKLEQNYKSIRRLISAKNSKHTFIKVRFEQEFKEYQRNYEKIVSEAAEPAKLREQRKLDDIFREEIQKWLESGKTEKEFWEEWEKAIAKTGISIYPFNPLEDDPASLIEDAFWWWEVSIQGVTNDDEVKHYKKAQDAWRFFTDKLGLDFSGINKRWLAATEIFIQPHVAQLDDHRIVELYSEAVRAYAFGCKIVSVAICRALMEYILKNHYNFQKNDLYNIIALAESRNPQLKKLRMQNKREFSNNMLHNYETGINIEDKAVIEYLRTIKELIENVPKRNI